MSDLLSAQAVADKAKAAGLSIPELCRGADIALSTFYRWKNGKNRPTMDVYERLCRTVERAEKKAA